MRLAQNVRFSPNDVKRAGLVQPGALVDRYVASASLRLRRRQRPTIAPFSLRGEMAYPESRRASFATKSTVAR
jgi:hypothetical protein